MLEGAVSVVSPGAYAVSDGGGDIGVEGEQGLFYKDTRHLSKLTLTVNGAPPARRGCTTENSRARFFLAVPAGGREDGLSVTRRRTLGAGMREEILFANRTGGPVEAAVELRCEADLRDVFDVRGFSRAEERGELSHTAEDGRLRFAYARDGFQRGTVVRASSEGVEPVVGPDGISLALRLGAGEERTVRVSVTFEEDGEETPPDLRPGSPGALYAGSPALETGWEDLRAGWEQSVEDLESLAFDAGGGAPVPAAGAPWYMALFGRDPLITAYQTMILGPQPAKNTLKALAFHQADDFNDYRDAEPGKIPHELRLGELARFGEVPHAPYYGTADATPLFLILLHEVFRWAADTEFVRELEQPARRAVTWVLDRTTADERGYITYQTRSTAGLKNQGWKDSPDSVRHRDGTVAEGPVALCEIQGYAYDALLKTAELAQDVWRDTELAAELRGEAERLRDRFEEDFWMEERGFYALALDGAGQQVGSLTSNPGHLLWSGIVSGGRAKAVADRLMGEDLFSGWGVRTMGCKEAAYDPESYHNGSVWPHDNALIACGLWRYGLRKEAGRLGAALVGAAPHFGYRLPEVFGGYSREESPEPVELPRACSPQAWAAGTVPLLVRVMLGIEPDPRGQRLLSDPAPPPGVPGFRLDG